MGHGKESFKAAGSEVLDILMAGFVASPQLPSCGGHYGRVTLYIGALTPTLAM